MHLITDLAGTVDLDPRVIAELEADLAAPQVTHARADFVYDTSIDSPNYTVDGAGPSSITIHWWGSPSLHRSGVGLGVARYLSTRAARASAHYVATVQTTDRAKIVYQLIADADNAWHSGSTVGNATSLGIEMMPYDNQTPGWQIDALLELAAELVASLWHRWPNLRNKPLHGHQYWVRTACPGSYQLQLDRIHRRAQQLYPHARGFGQFDQAPSPTPSPNTPLILEDDMILIINETAAPGQPPRGMALIALGQYFAVPPAYVDVAHQIATKIVRFKTPTEWDLAKRIALDSVPNSPQTGTVPAPVSLSDAGIKLLVDAVRAALPPTITAAEVAAQLKVVTK